MRRLTLAVLLTCVATAGGLRAQQTFVFERLLLTGSPAPGLDALVDEIGLYVDIFNPDPFAGGPQIGTNGGVGLSAQVGGDGHPSTRDGFGSAVWRASGSSITPAARRGNPAPGTSSQFTAVFSPFDTDDGVVFAGTVANPGGPDRFGLWSSRGGPLNRILLEGEPLDGIPAGATMFAFAFVARGTSVVVEGRWCFGKRKRSLDADGGDLPSAARRYRASTVRACRRPGAGPAGRNLHRHKHGPTVRQRPLSLDRADRRSGSDRRPTYRAADRCGWNHGRCPAHGPDARRPHGSEFRRVVRSARGGAVPQQVFEVLFTDGSAGVYRGRMQP
jgi:hypothetical protein